MPLKIGKSKSSSGTELVNVHSPSNDEIVPPKKKGLKKFFMQKSKIPTSKQSSSDDNQIKYKDKPSELCETPVNSSPMRATCHSVSPKLYTNSCTSSTEELTNFGNSINQNSQSNAAVRDVIIEEDYEDALTVNNNNLSQRPSKLSSSIPVSIASAPVIPPKKLSITSQSSAVISTNPTITNTTISTTTPTSSSAINSSTSTTLYNAPLSSTDNPSPQQSDVTCTSIYTPALNTVAISLNNKDSNSVHNPDDDKDSNDDNQQSQPSQQSIYNVPVDALQNKNTNSNNLNNNAKDIIETYRLSQITPTNQFNDIRSRCCSDADSLPVHHSDIGGVTSRGSTGSSPVSSAHTLSESPAVYPHPISSCQLASSCTSSTTASPQQHQTSTNEMKDVSVHNSVNGNQSQSRHPKQQPQSQSQQAQYNNSPKGNTVICHHPSSPFAPPSTSISTIPSKSPTTSLNNQASKNTPMTTTTTTVPVTNASTNTSTTNHVSRRPGKLNKQNPGMTPNQSQDSNNCDNESSMLVNEIRNLTEPPIGLSQKPLKDQHQQQPIYEEAWDVKIHKLFQDKQQTSHNSSSSPGIITMIQRPQSAVSGATEHKNILSSQLAYLNRTSSPNNTSTSNHNQVGATRNTTTPKIIPPAVPPHRRSSDHIKSTTLFMPHTAASNSSSSSNSRPVTTNNSIARSMSTQLPLLQSHTNTSSIVKKHAINPAFQDHQSRQETNKTRHNDAAIGADNAGSDYDYAYNDTWSLGVKRTMNCNLSGSHDESSNNSQKLPISRGNRHSLTSQPPSSSHHLSTNNQYLDKIDSVESENSPGDSSNSSCISANPVSAPVAIPVTKATGVPNNKNLLSPGIRSASSNSGGGGGGGGVDNDTWSNDSYEEPWDIRHGRVFQELTSTRLVDPTSVLGSVSTATTAVSTSTANSCSGVARQLSSSTVVSGNTNNTGGAVGNTSSAGASSNRNRSVSGNSITNSTSRSISCTNPSATGNSSNNSSLININIPLEDQPWYHEHCTRVKAENLLSLAPEGSFLVRKSETCRNNFSLTIKHRSEFLHMKISQNQSGYILGQYSQPYVSIPHMLQHYSLSMVPVCGAATVQLTNPVTR